MAWLEMSRDPAHRPVEWRVGQCLWSPRKKENGSSWGFWETMREVQAGDVVFHLCGSSDNAAFIGFSTAAAGCESINLGPLGPQELFRVELKDFKALPSPVPLKKVLRAKDQELRDYFEANTQRSRLDKERLFYVIQSKKLQCLNGAYLSYLSDELLRLLLDIDVSCGPGAAALVAPSTPTGVVLKEAAARVGQQVFSHNVKRNYRYQCCFPGCGVSDPRFLIGSHIARWADHPTLRGETNNGLCLCVVHDKAFEIGAFTFNASFEVILRRSEPAGSWLVNLLQPAAGKALARPPIAPSLDALAQHWLAHGFDTGQAVPRNVQAAPTPASIDLNTR